MHLLCPLQEQVCSNSCCSSFDIATLPCLRRSIVSLPIELLLWTGYIRRIWGPCQPTFCQRPCDYLCHLAVCDKPDSVHDRYKEAKGKRGGRRASIKSCHWRWTKDMSHHISTAAGIRLNLLCCDIVSSFALIQTSVAASQWSVGGMCAPLAFGAVVINIKSDCN